MCDTVVVVEPGRVLFAKNSDRDPNEAQVLDWQPAREWPSGATVRCTWIEIPQVRRTYAVLLSRPFWMWGAEIGANEHGVVMGNEAVFTRLEVAETGLTGMDLVRLVLERSTDAEGAVNVLTRLLEQHGQGGGCGLENPSFRYHNSFLIADADGAFVAETAGRHWAVERVDRGVRSISNGLTIDGFAQRYRSRLDIEARVARARTRRGRTSALACRVSDVGDMFALLRDHGPGRDKPAYSPISGAHAAPCVHAGGLFGSQTVASWVAELTPDGVHHWVTGTSAPCTSLFKPVVVTSPIDTGVVPTEVDDGGASLWWRHERLHRTVARDPDRLMRVFLTERDALERAWRAERPSPEAAFAEGERRLEAWTRAARRLVSRDRRPFWVRRYWNRRDRMADLDLLGQVQPTD